jgi:hypothetical protein
MSALNNAYAAHAGELKKDALYLFLLGSSGSSKKGTEAAGFMPRQQQVGYLFTENAGKNLPHTLAHELGHGMANLAHTFDRTKYNIEKNSIQNLMDYAGGTQLVKLQWDQLHDPGEVWKIVERDEEAMMFTRCHTTAPKDNGTKEGEVRQVKGVLSSHAYTECFVDYYYHTGRDEQEAGWYELDKYLKLPYVEEQIVNFGFLNGDIRHFSRNEEYISNAEKSITYLYDSRLVADNFWDIVVRNNSKYAQLCSEKNLYHSGSGKVEISNIDIDLLSLFSIKAASSLIMLLSEHQLTKNFLSKIPAIYRAQVKQAFDGRIVVKYAEENMVLYRHISKDGPEISYWFSRTMESPTNAKKLLALPKNNTAEWVVKVNVKKGTPYIEGKVASQANDIAVFGNYATGGGNQLYFLQEDWVNLVQDGSKFINPLK